MIGIIMDRAGNDSPSHVCDECLGALMTVVAYLDRDHFEKLVEAARAYRPGDETPDLSS